MLMIYVSRKIKKPGSQILILIKNSLSYNTYKRNCSNTFQRIPPFSNILQSVFFCASLFMRILFYKFRFRAKKPNHFFWKQTVIIVFFLHKLELCGSAARFKPIFGVFLFSISRLKTTWTTEKAKRSRLFCMWNKTDQKSTLITTYT